MSARTGLALIILAAGSVAMYFMARWQAWDFDAWYRAEYSQPTPAWLAFEAAIAREQGVATTQPAACPVIARASPASGDSDLSCRVFGR